MLQQMFESSRPQLLIAVLLLGFGLFLLGSGRGASPMLWGGNWGFHAHLDTQSTNTWTAIPR